MASETQHAQIVSIIFTDYPEIIVTTHHIFTHGQPYLCGNGISFDQPQRSFVTYLCN